MFYYNFDTVLYQFLDTETSDRTDMFSINFWDSQVSAYNPFHFFLYTPLILRNMEKWRIVSLLFI